MNQTASRLTCMLPALLIATAASASSIWDGPDVTIIKPAFSGVQDMLTPNVILTRGSSQGIYNAAQETGYDMVGFTSPADTKWAFLGLNGNPSGPAELTASNFANLTFLDWAPALEGAPSLFGNITNRPGVVHLVSDDIYLNIEFTEWGGGATGGSFTYVRSTKPVSPGDTDGDGDVDDADLGTAFSNFTGPIGAAGGKTAGDGDTDGDGDIDDADLGTAFSNFTGPLSPAPLPEPSSVTLLVVAGAMAIRRRRHRYHASCADADAAVSC